MNTPIYDKTDKGREEISTRKYHLASKLRSLLLLIDGKSDIDTVLKKLGGVEQGSANVEELVAQGYIAQVHTLAPSSAAASSPATATVPLAAAKPDKAQTEEPILAEGQTQFAALYQFYTSTVKENLGLRGYGLQLKVERCGSIEEFRGLRNTYVEAITKSKGADVAAMLAKRLDRLLSL